MDTIEAEFNAFSSTFEILELIALVFLIGIVSEAVWDIFKKNRNLGETIANVCIGLGNILLERTLYGLVFVIALFITEMFAPFSIPYTWWSWGLALVLADFTYYWMHRIEHKIRFFWAYHSVHHSSPEFNLSTALRLAWIEGMIEWLFFVPMILIGFEVVQVIICISVVVAYQTWIHTEKINTLGYLDKVFNTPSVHRVHHGSNQEYLDKNFGGILIIWDRLFNTYQAEEAPVVYGITKPINSINPVIINIHEYWSILMDMKNAKGFLNKCACLLREPEPLAQEGDKTKL